jgi:RimJ/RimL family protein N-acetyltransferase
MRREARDGTRYDLAVEFRGVRRVVGRVALKQVDRADKRAELAYWFGPEYWGHGLASEAAYYLCRAAFQELRLHRIDAQVFEHNERSIALVKRLGFRHEGTLREAARFQRRWLSLLQFGLLREDLRISR